TREALRLQSPKAGRLRSRLLRRQRGLLSGSPRLTRIEGWLACQTRHGDATPLALPVGIIIERLHARAPARRRDAEKTYDLIHTADHCDIGEARGFQGYPFFSEMRLVWAYFAKVWRRIQNAAP